MSNNKTELNNNKWNPPLFDLIDIVPGDMPGDKIEIDDSHIKRANSIFPYLLDELNKADKDKLVISVYGGSGVGKSEIGSIISHYCKLQGFKSYVISGDNYPYRIPEENDRERYNRFRYAGISALSIDKNFSSEWNMAIQKSWELGDDTDPTKIDNEPFFKTYQDAGKDSLKRYLGTEKEVDFPLVNKIIHSFKDGVKNISLKRMGRSPNDIGFEAMDFSNIKVLIIEWTHGNNSLVNGVDIPVFLFSTPDETLAHRLKRARDKGADSSFVNMVLGLEQEKLNSQAEKAALIVKKSGDVISYKIFLENTEEK